MPSRIDDTTIPLVSCAGRMNQLPKDEAQSAEADGYVAYFCSPACFDKWRATDAGAQKPNA